MKNAVDMTFNLDIVSCDLYPEQDVEFQITDQSGGASVSRLVVLSCTMRVCASHACQSDYRTRFIETGFSACSNVIVTTRLPHNGGVCTTYGSSNPCQRNYYCVPAKSFPPTSTQTSLSLPGTEQITSSSMQAVTSSTMPAVQSRYWRIASLDYSRPLSIVELKFGGETPSGGECFPKDIYESCSKVLDGNLMSESRSTRWTAIVIGSEDNPNFWAYDFGRDRAVTSFSLIQYPETNKGKMFTNELSLQYSTNGNSWTEYLRTCVSVGDETWRVCNTSVSCSEVDFTINEKVAEEEEEIEWNIKTGGWIVFGAFTAFLFCCLFLLYNVLYGSGTVPGAEEEMIFQCCRWIIISGMILCETCAMIASLVEQRACPMSYLLLMGLELQFVNMVFIMNFLPCFQPSGMSDVAQLHVMYTIVVFNLVSLIFIVIPAFACPDMNLEDGFAAAVGGLGLAITIFFAVDSPRIWIKKDSTNQAQGPTP